MFNERFGIGANLHVIPMRGWTARCCGPDTGLQWVQTSPNIPEWQTTLVYLCTGLIDNAGVNNGTGFTKPFFFAGTCGHRRQRTGAATELAQSARGVLPAGGVVADRRILERKRACPASSSSSSSPRLFKRCEPRSRFSSPSATSFRTRSTSKPPRSTRTGEPRSLRQGLLSGKSAKDIVATWSAPVDSFMTSREKYLLYEELIGLGACATAGSVLQSI